MGHAEGSGGHDDVHTHIAIFDLDEAEPAGNQDKCARILKILQDRASPTLAFWCERRRHRR